MANILLQHFLFWPLLCMHGSIVVDHSSSLAFRSSFDVKAVLSPLPDQPSYSLQITLPQTSHSVNTDIRLTHILTSISMFLLIYSCCSVFVDFFKILLFYMFYIFGKKDVHHHQQHASVWRVVLVMNSLHNLRSAAR